MKVFALGHPLAPEAKAWLEEQLGPVEAYHVPIPNVDMGGDMRMAARSLLDNMIRAGADVDSPSQIVITLPGLTELAACLLALLMGRSGMLPSFVAMRRVEKEEGGPSSWMPHRIHPIINLERERTSARGRRGSNPKKNQGGETHGS